MAFKNTKRSAYINKDKLRVNCDGTTIEDRKPNLNLKSNHFRYVPVFRPVKTKPITKGR